MGKTKVFTLKELEIATDHFNENRILGKGGQGCCLETQVPLLVYEFVPNGTLFHYLQDHGNEFQLTWEMCVRVASEAAGAISYLHSVASVPIYHRDIKSTNILLDEKYGAKVSDFGISKTIAIDQSHVTTLFWGCSFELLTGMSPVSFARIGEDRSLVTYFIDSMEEDKLFDILDARIIEINSSAQVNILDARIIKTNSNAQEIISAANLAMVPKL
ncbi:hypothetical protein DITRI_Ditri18aG0098800 [Diplodiscus trichospermus]